MNSNYPTVLFLDFDGVTHPEPCTAEHAFSQLPLVESILRDFVDVEVVISSSWRSHFTLDSLRLNFSDDIRARVIGVTPSVIDSSWNPAVPEFDRQFEIEHWIEEHRPGANWIALDDRAEWFEPGCTNLLLTDKSTGFIAQDTEKLRNLLMHAQLNSALQKIWFLGDVHGSFNHIQQALLAARFKPSWLLFLGDVDIDHMPFSQVLDPLHRDFPGTKFAFVHGNHDADSYDHWNNLHDAGAAVPLHGEVEELDGVRVAGLGGTFLDRVWMPPKQPLFQSKSAAMNRGSFQFRDGQRPNPAYLGAIYPDDFYQLARQRADILIMHEAPSCHPYGFAKLDELARSLGVLRAFHGHTHDDLTEQYKTQWGDLGFEAIGVNYCSIKNGLGEVIVQGPEGR